MSFVSKFSHEDFIGIYETRFDCSLLMNYYKYCETNKVELINRNEVTSNPDTEKIDNHVKDCRVELSYTSQAYNVSPFDSLLKPLNDCLAECIQKYGDRYEVLKYFQLQNAAALIQKTRPGEGYHLWHCEDGMPANMHRRKLTWMIYLNDIDDGGETEFLYLHKRIKPKKGTVLIWPVNFTHAHRGNPPLKEDKYVATGWLESKT
tara:strand:+ start:565 stop:1179 length:615 start_codon:yes stop_codon:yes gene_type:complete